MNRIRFINFITLVECYQPNNDIAKHAIDTIAHYLHRLCRYFCLPCVLLRQFRTDSGLKHFIRDEYLLLLIKSQL